MTVLLPTDDVGVWDPQPVDDEHGWATETTGVLVWSGPGSVQEALPVTSAQAADAGGAGPLLPQHQRTAQVYLPPEVGVAPGHLLHARGVEWLVLRVHVVADPAGVGVGCLVLDAAERQVTP